MQNNLILSTDSYKMSHFLQYPKGTQYVSSYIESRGTLRDWNELVFLGLQGFLRTYLNKRITMDDIDEAEAIAKSHGVPFNRAGWEYIWEKCDGYLPLEIKALPEGTVVPMGVPLVQIVNTDLNVPWVTSYIETALLRAIWYPTTTATLSRSIKKNILTALIETGSDESGIDFMLNDFGARGVSSSESAQLGGFGHLVSFKGTDNIESIMYAREHYYADMPAFSVIASEHSTMTAWGRENEVDAYRNMLSLARQGDIISVVSDSYDIFWACEELWGKQLKAEVQDLARLKARLVVRPDSGDPITTPVEVVKSLMNSFGCKINRKGYKTLPSYIRVLQGDGIDEPCIKEILQHGKENGLAADNFVFGMGGALLQRVERDSLKFAMKANAICIDGVWKDVYKDPLHGAKTSKKGMQAVVSVDGKLVSKRLDELLSHETNLLETYYLNGDMVAADTLENIRKRAKI